MNRIPYRDTWTPVAGNVEREFRVLPRRQFMQAHPRKSDVRRLVETLAALVVLVAGLLVIVAAMSLAPS